MIWHSRIELEREGSPSRKELLWALTATPLLLAQIVVWSLRIIRGFDGEPLIVSSLFEIDFIRAEPSWHFAAGVAMYIACIAIAVVLLWACTLQFQRWAYWRRKR